jgi:hypothetical protein
MGAHPYWYFVEYRPDLDEALQELREREFQAGRYNPVTPFPTFPLDLSEAPGAQHDSIEDAQEDAAEDGTRSILDLSMVGDEPDYDVAARIPDSELLNLYGTTKPTREMLESDLGFFSEDMERGQGVCTIVYKGGQPVEILFAGLSFD